MSLTIASPDAGLLSRLFSQVRPAARRLLVAAGVALAGFGAIAQEVDPPGRVARLNLMQGNVSQLPAGDNDWSQAEINRPLTTGDRLRTEPGARLELHSGSTAVRLDGAASLDISQLDDNTTRLTLSEGTLNLRVRNLYPGEQVEIDTPNLALTVQQPGSFRLEVDPRFGTTRVSARSGAATVYGENAESVPITANGQVLAFAARNLSQAGLAAPIQTDGFDQWADARDRAEDQSISARYVSRDMPGYQQLDSFGDWQNDATYGAVWLPRVTVAEWAPYRYGQWRWIAPWGWTWVDDAPWGFAPFHYGRWAQIGPRWAWVPGPRGARPTYAPALVGFLGGQPGRAEWNVHGGPDRRPGPGIGWFPLAPGEAWRPGFRASPSYLGGINRDGHRDGRDGRDGRGSRDGDRPYHFQGRPNAVTAVPQADFGRGPSWRPNRPNLRDGDLAGTQLLQAPPMRPGGNRADFDGRRPERSGNDHPNWNNAARSQAEQNQRAQIQAEEARQRQQDALQRPSLERQAQQDRLSQENQRRQVEQLQRQQQWQQQQQQQQQQHREGRNQIDPAGPRPQFQQERLQREREQRDQRDQAERAQRDQQQRQQVQQQREQQNIAEQLRARQQAQQAQQGEQLRREQQAQQERMQRDVAQREQIQRQQQQQQQQMQQQQQQRNQVDPQGLRGRVQQAQPQPQPQQPADQGRQSIRQQLMNREQR
jgi:hypothetical protein